MAKKDRVGEVFETNEGYVIEIVEYNSSSDLWVEFQDGHGARVRTQYDKCQSEQKTHKGYKWRYID